VGLKPYIHVGSHFTTLSFATTNSMLSTHQHPPHDCATYNPDNRKLISLLSPTGG
jgi:hypothetical protein